MSQRWRGFVPGGGTPLACPYCGHVLLEGVFHSCRELRADLERAPRQYNLSKIGDTVLILLVIVVAAFLGAHFLVSQGVGCPGAN